MADFQQEDIEERAFGHTPMRPHRIGPPPGRYTMFEIDRAVARQFFNETGLTLGYYGA